MSQIVLETSREQFSGYMIWIALDTAQAFWGLLLPHGLQGGALSHVDDDEDVKMGGTGSEGFKQEHIQWWFDFLQEKNMKGVSKDVWQMVCDHSIILIHARLQLIPALSCGTSFGASTHNSRTTMKKVRDDCLEMLLFDSELLFQALGRPLLTSLWSMHGLGSSRDLGIQSVS